MKKIKEIKLVNMNDFSFKNLTIKEFNQGLIKGEFSAFEATKSFFDFIKKKDKKIKAFLNLCEENALEQASRVDVALGEKKNLGLLAGVPIAVKDNILVEGELCTAGSKILENYKAVYDATVVKKLKEAGAVIIGKTNMDEFAMGSSTENSAFYSTKNPYDLKRAPGGSSGGSAAAVASGMAIAALGSDTGGSIRQPASFCDIVGLKPSYGSVSRYGLIALASSLDQIGPMAKTVEDAEILFNIIKGEDKFDSTSVNFFEGRELSFNDLKGITIGLPEEYFKPEMPGEVINKGQSIAKEQLKGAGLELEVEEAVENVIETLKSLKIKFKKISLPHTKYALACYYIILPAEASTNLARFDGIRYSRNYAKKDTGLHKNNQPQPLSKFPKSALEDIYFKQRGDGFGDEVKQRIILGTFVLSAGYYDAYYKKAQKVRRLIKQDFEKAFSTEKVDMILSPVSPTLPFKIGERTGDPLAMYMSDIFTIPVNLAGLPAISIPVKNQKSAVSGQLPVGFQLIGKPFQEREILSVGKFYENLFK